MPRAPLAGKSALVTGGAGFIGSHLVDRLIADGVQEVVVVDNLFLGSEHNLDQARASGRLVFYREDAEFAASLEYIFSRHDVDTVFNCATKALNYSFANPSGAFVTNVNVALNLLELQRRERFLTLCHFSTSAVYGSAQYEPMDEQHPRAPTTTYAAGKAAADLAVESYVRMFGLDAFIVRPFNNYGPRQNAEGPLAGVIPLTAMRILRGVTPELHGDGTQSRDFILVDDTVEAVMQLRQVVPPGESVNVCADNQISIGTLLEMIRREMAFSGPLQRGPGRPSDVSAHLGSTKKLERLIEFRPTPFDTGLRHTLGWYRERYGDLPASRGVSSP